MAVWVGGAGGSAALLLAAMLGRAPLAPVEVLGFATGAAAVWLTVRANNWLWPVSIANNVFFFLLFANARLYADAGLQVVYLVLEGLGWYWWLRGGDKRQGLPIRRAGWVTLGTAAGVTVSGTAAMSVFLGRVNDSAPLLDAFTTVLSLVAQFMLARKLLQNWWVWIGADVVYVGLYAWKGLLLTAVLYALFLAMCLVGLREWSRDV